MLSSLPTERRIVVRRFSGRTATIRADAVRGSQCLGFDRPSTAVHRRSGANRRTSAVSLWNLAAGRS